MKSCLSRGRASILVVDDDLAIRESLEEILCDDYNVTSVESGFRALDIIKRDIFDVILLDVTMPQMDGLETLRRMKAYKKALDIVMVSAHDRAREAAEAIRGGAYDYVTKPFDPVKILGVIERVLEKREQELEVEELRKQVREMTQEKQIIYQSVKMSEVMEMIDKIAPTPGSVLVTGETGTGKELVARSIHNRSERNNRPFVAVNCASIPDNLLESELFGHTKGSFTGATVARKGKFEFANGGTIFLDEIATLKLDMQAKLLRVLQEREVTKVGSNDPVKIDVRLVAAANVKLRDMVNKGDFREDLFYRLNVIPLTLPPLRERYGDVPLLANYFLERLNESWGKSVAGFSTEAMKVIEAYSWPGNIRQLENMVQYCVSVIGNGELIEQYDLLPEILFPSGDPEENRLQSEDDMDLVEARRKFEREYIGRALRQCKGNRSEAAVLLKVHRNTLVNRIKALGLEDM